MAGRDVPKAWYEGLERMWNYYAYSLRPNGYGVLNNDSNLDFNRRLIMDLYEQYERPDWAYIATNGAQGIRPVGPPSVMFPWAGQLISRSGWDAAAHWSVLDVGPWGIGHQHQDKLHLSVSAFGQDFLVDAGRLYYKNDAWRRFIRGTKAHNTFLIDGCEQNPDVEQTESPLGGDDYVIEKSFDFARGTFSAGYAGLEGEATHTRVVMYVRGLCWIVVDRVESENPRRLQGLWHTHPACDVRLAGIRASVQHEAGNVLIAPVCGGSWRVEAVKGDGPPNIQGWYSPEYNQKDPATCLIYSRDVVAGPSTSVWLLVPYIGGQPTVEADVIAETDMTWVTAKIGSENVQAVLPLHGGAPSLSR